MTRIAAARWQLFPVLIMVPACPPRVCASLCLDFIAVCIACNCFCLVASAFALGEVECETRLRNMICTLPAASGMMLLALCNVHCRASALLSLLGMHVGSWSESLFWSTARCQLVACRSISASVSARTSSLVVL